MHSNKYLYSLMHFLYSDCSERIIKIFLLFSVWQGSDNSNFRIIPDFSDICLISDVERVLNKIYFKQYISYKYNQIESSISQDEQFRHRDDRRKPATGTLTTHIINNCRRGRRNSTKTSSIAILE